MTTTALVLSSLALATSLTALALAVTVMRQSGHTTGVVRRHRIAHQRAEGFADPVPEKEPDHEPRGAQRYEPPTGTFPAVDVDTVEHPAARPLPRTDTPA